MSECKCPCCSLPMLIAAPWQSQDITALYTSGCAPSAGELARRADLLRELMDGRARRQGGTRRRQVVQAPDAPVPQPLEGFLPGGAHAVEQRGVEGAAHSVELRQRSRTSLAIHNHSNRR